MQGANIGSVEIGNVFSFAVTNRADDGTELNISPTHFDVIDNLDGTIIRQDQPMVIRGTDTPLWFGRIDTRDIDTDQSGPFEPGRTYSILVRDNTVTDDPRFHYQFTVTTAFTDRLKRILGLQGENMLLDLFDYDSGGNATGFRVRLFSTRAAAAQATRDITDVPEAGEFATYTVTQTFGTGRMTRQSSLNLIDEDKGDG
jgi:hypothetical protein